MCCAILLALSAVAAAAEGPRPTPAPTPAPAPNPATAACRRCHDSLVTKAHVHRAAADSCTDCHEAAPGARGACGSSVASAWKLTAPRNELCALCHPSEDLTAALAVKHAPAADGRCLACHDPHASARPHLVRDEPRKLCLRCHDGFGARAVAVGGGASEHAPFEQGCDDCHQGPHGGALPKLLRQAPPDLCLTCHDRKDTRKVVHEALKIGTCVDCHTPHSSDERPLLKAPIERVCAECHDLAKLAPGPFRHAATEGRCGACHDAHSSDEPKLLRTAASTLCLACHDAKAPKGLGTASAKSRVDLGRKHVHGALEGTTCLGCHDGGHSSQRPRLLRAPVADLCYECHDRQDGGPYVHGAVLLGKCEGCHEPHASDFPKLARSADLRSTCFSCHSDEVLTGKVIHPPFADGCGDCHAPHSARAPMLLTMGGGAETCRGCHPDVGIEGKPHTALVRYGCTGCHDPHSAPSPALLPYDTNALCASCHPDQRDTDGLMAAGAPYAKERGARRGREPLCTACHDPHAADRPNVLRATPRAASTGLP